MSDSNQYEIIPTQLNLGEGIRWHPTEQTLYWVDIYEGNVYRMHPETQDIEHIIDLDVAVSAIAFREKGGLILTTRNGFARTDANFENIVFFNDPEEHRTNCRFNDASVDRRGRLWAGSMIDGEESNEDSKLYRLDPDGTLHVMEGGFNLLNGIDWSPDGKIMYVTDSLNFVIWQYDYDEESGTISNKRAFVRIDAGEPDGLTVDTDGYVWTARWGEWKVFRFAPDGTLERTVELPVKHPTAVHFAGPDLSRMCITSAFRPLSDDERSAQPHAGDIFVMDTEFHGFPVNFYKG